MNDKQILVELGVLIAKGKKFHPELNTIHELQIGYESNTSFYPLLTKWEYTIFNILKLRFGEDSDFMKRFTECIKSHYGSHVYYKENVGLAIASLEFIYESLSKGFTDDLFYQREMILFGDLLEQAEEFLKNNHKAASAIYGRIVLEATIIEFAKKKCLEVGEKFDQLIIKLRKAGFIHQPFENSLRANYKIGSLAAHGDVEFNQLSDSEIREFLSFVRDKVLTLS